LKTELIRDAISASDFGFAIVVSRWNDSFTSRLEAGARMALLDAGADEDHIEVFRVPGAFELPLAALKAAESGRFDAVIALGVVIRGDTPHFEFVAGQAAAGLMQASIKSAVPVLFGVITADTIEQTEARCGDGTDNKGYEAAQSAIEMAELMRQMEVRNDESFRAKLESLNVA